MHMRCQRGSAHIPFPRRAGAHTSGWRADGLPLPFFVGFIVPFSCAERCSPEGLGSWRLEDRGHLKQAYIFLEKFDVRVQTSIFYLKTALFSALIIVRKMFALGINKRNVSVVRSL